jgi:hypothetical protein
VGQGIEREIQLQDIDPPLSEQSKLAPFRVLSHKRLNCAFLQASRTGHSLHLV